MTSRHRHKSKYQAVPQKPDLEITNFQAFDEQNETNAPGLDIEYRTDVKHGRGTDTTTDDYEFNVPVNIPARDSLAIDLVPADLVFRLEEYRSDESRLAALFYTFLGALLGFITTLAISEPFEMTGPTLIVGILLLMVSIIFFWLMRTYKARADKKTQEINKHRKIKS